MLGWWVSVCAVAVALVFRVPLGRTTALAYSGAAAGTMPAGSADVPGEEEEPQPASAVVMTASASRMTRKASKRGDRRCGTGRSYSRTHAGASRQVSRSPLPGGDVQVALQARAVQEDLHHFQLVAVLGIDRKKAYERAFSAFRRTHMGIGGKKCAIGVALWGKVG